MLINKSKKLKKIPTNLLAYITIETEGIKDSRDKRLISAYTMNKLETVEWYIQLIDTQNQKYEVPHSKTYLEEVRNQLKKCHRKIMDAKLVEPSRRPLLDIKYPEKYDN